MADLKSIKDNVNSFENDGKIGIFNISKKVEAFGENQNQFNSIISEKFEELTKRICSLEKEKDNNKEIFKRVANELKSLKDELDRIKLTTKLNTNTIDRLNSTIQELEEK